MNTATAVKYNNRPQLFNLFPSKRTQETAKLISKLKLAFGARFTGFDLDCSGFDKTRPNAGISVALTKVLSVVYEHL